MSRSCCLAVSVLLAIAATSSATLPVLLHEEHLEEATATGLLVAEGPRVAALSSTWAANKVSAPQPLEARPSGGMATQGDDQSSSGGSSGEHGKEEGASKEREAGQELPHQGGVPQEEDALRQGLHALGAQQVRRQLAPSAPSPVSPPARSRGRAAGSRRLDRSIECFSSLV
ncbi:unnamed protein product [Miscanthus lutarioriparius]|uniref:Uncharacterized protein n=1 Tax=Miscanthus lutarioriparius TaxID=422564 RepID=A0A811QTD4_9POAL|nr:unnamed protein product [Miscanthus lutarioriparius]